MVVKSPTGARGGAVQAGVGLNLALCFTETHVNVMRTHKDTYMDLFSSKKFYDKTKTVDCV